MKTNKANKTCWVLSYSYLDEVNKTVLFCEKPDAEKLAFHMQDICSYYLKFRSKSEALTVAEDLLEKSYSSFDLSLSLDERNIY